MNIQHGSMMTSEQISEDICRKIETLEYMPGDKLSENELCGVYGVTRHMIRNSLTTLKQRRLVDVYPQRGTYVSLIDMDYIEDILYMREAVEQEAVYRIISSADNAKVVSKLKKAVDAQNKWLEKKQKNNDEFYELDNNFHQALFEAIGRANVMSLISEPYIHIRRWRNFEIRSQVRMKEIVSEHEEIIKAIENNDLEQGRKMLHLHLDTVNRYSQDLKEREPEYFA